jgi:hypothetical protein
MRTRQWVDVTCFTNHNIEMSCSQNMIIDELDEDYIKELAQSARDVMKRNNNKPIRLLMPIRRKETIMELKGTDNLEQWDKDLCEYGWLIGREEWLAKTNESFQETMGRIEGENRAHQREGLPD